MWVKEALQAPCTPLESLDWEALDHSEDKLPLFVVEMFRQLGLTGTVVEEGQLFCFLRRLQERYVAHPYHNFVHAVDVTHMGECAVPST